MLMSVKEMRGHLFVARDGEIGKVNDLYFDDDQWTVRYLVDKTGFLGRQVLIAPVAITEINNDQEMIRVNLTREQIEDSPPLDREKPLSRDLETKIIEHYRWPAYLGGADALSEAGYTQSAAPHPLSWSVKRTIARDPDYEGPNLHSSVNVIGYKIATNNGDLGAVEDLLVDDKTWEIRYLLIETQKAMNSKKLLIDPEWIDWISWKQKRVSVSMDREKIKGCPKFDMSLPIPREYEKMLYEHYECKAYWDRQ